MAVGDSGPLGIEFLDHCRLADAGLFDDFPDEIWRLHSDDDCDGRESHADIAGQDPEP